MVLSFAGWRELLGDNMEHMRGRTWKEMAALACFKINRGLYKKVSDYEGTDA